MSSSIYHRFVWIVLLPIQMSNQINSYVDLPTQTADLVVHGFSLGDFQFWYVIGYSLSYSDKTLTLMENLPSYAVSWIKFTRIMLVVKNNRFFCFTYNVFDNLQCSVLKQNNRLCMK